MAVEGPLATAYPLSPERSPEEALGAAAAGSLGQNLVSASIGTAVLMVVLTVGPWALAKAGFFAAAPVAKAAPAASAESAKRADTAVAAAPASTGEPAAGASESAGAAPKGDAPAKGPQVLERLGIGQEKQAPPGVNPLEGRTDDLFKDP